MNDHDLINALVRIAEGAVKALGNRHNRSEMVANLEFAQANLRYALDALKSGS